MNQIIKIERKAHQFTTIGGNDLGVEGLLLPREVRPLERLRDLGREGQPDH